MMAIVFLALLTATPVLAQDAASERVMAAVRAAMAPALPFPATGADGTLPADNSTEPQWMIRTNQGDRTIDVLANPLNAAVQLRANRAMAQIENNIQAAQRRATLQYEAAVAEAKRTGRSQAVDGVSLSDEGVAGERIDAESYASIVVEFHEREYRFLVPGSMEPRLGESFHQPDVEVLTVPGHVYKDEADTEHYAESHRIILLGRDLDTKVTKQKDGLYVVTAVPTAPATAGLDSLAVHVRGNAVLVADILAKTNWSQLLELLK